MKLNLNDFKRKWQFPVLMLCGTLPAAIIAVVGMAPQLLDRVWMFPAVYLVLALLLVIIPGKRRLIAGLIGCALMLALGLWQLPVSVHYMLPAVPLIYIILLLSGLSIGGWGHDEEIHPRWYIVGVVCHIAGQIAVNVAQRTDMYPGYLATSPIMLISFIAFALLSMLSLNRGTMSNASMGRQRIPSLMRHRNVLLTFALLALVLLLASLPAVAKAVMTVWDWLVAAVFSLLALLTRLMPDNASGGDGGGGGENSGLPGAEITEPSMLVQILEKIAYVLVAIGLVAIAIFTLRFLYRKLKILLQYLWKKLSEYAAAATEDYEDEVTDTREGGQRERTDMVTALRKRLTRVDEKKLTPAERIRYRYQRLMHKHSEWLASQTARETLPDPSAQLYERARYSDQEISAQEAEDFANNTKSL